MDSVGVVVLHDDPSVVEDVVGAVEASPGLFVVSTVAGSAGGQVILAGGSALLHVDHAKPVVALADGEPVRTARAALAVGARDLLVWPAEAARLDPCLRAAAGSAVAVGTGRLIVVAGARGGVGCSTLGALLAVAAGDGIYLDLDRSGTGMRALDAAIVAAFDLLDVTPDALDAASVALAGDARALHGLGGADRSRAVIAGLARAARALAPVAIIDAGRAPVATDLADDLILVASNDVASVHGARALLAAHPGPWRLAVRPTRRLGAPVRDVAAAIGVGAAAVVPSDARLARALDLGRLPERSRAGRAAARLLVEARG